MRTYQQETGRTATPLMTDSVDSSAKSDDMEELKHAFDGMDVEEEYIADVRTIRRSKLQLRAAMLESLKESQNNESDKKEDNEKKNDNKDNNEEVDLSICWKTKPYMN